MAINLAHFEFDNQKRWGVVKPQGYMLLPVSYASTAELISQLKPDYLKTLDTQILDPQRTKLLSPITRNQQFICQGANYRQHMVESGIDPDNSSFNMIFTKASSCIVAADSNVIRPSRVQCLDYEVELGLVIGREISGPIAVNANNILDYVAGLVMVNDYSARDIQIPEMQFYKGKSFRSFGPVGPWLCLLEPQDKDYLLNLDLTLKVDGVVRQHDNTRNLVHKPVETLRELAGVQDFSPGDLLSTGTPAGCALSIPSPFKQKLGSLLGEKRKWALFMKTQLARTQYLRPGQRVEASIKSPDGHIDLGVQHNLIVQEGVAPAS